jgi:hypothetical protein
MGQDEATSSTSSSDRLAEFSRRLENGPTLDDFISGDFSSTTAEATQISTLTKTRRRR